MLQNQHQIPKAGNKIKTNHSRKQLLEWINKQAALYEKSPLLSSFNLNALKNGVFFLVILQKIIPSEAVLIKSKMKEKPVTEYDFEKNLILMKKVIEKHNLLNNLDINEILKSKNPLQFLSWMKNLNDGQIRLSNQQPKPESQKMVSPQKKFPLNSGYKTNRQSSSSKSGQKNLSQAKSNRNYSTSKTDNPFYKVKSGKNLVQIGHNQLPVLDNNRSHVVAQQSKMKKSAYMSEFDSLDDCNEALYQLALEQSIQSFRNILAKVKATANETDAKSLSTYLDQIGQAIFGKN